jgi:hypothetical protein
MTQIPDFSREVGDLVCHVSAIRTFIRQYGSDKTKTLVMTMVWEYVSVAFFFQSGITFAKLSAQRRAIANNSIFRNLLNHPQFVTKVQRTSINLN